VKQSKSVDRNQVNTSLTTIPKGRDTNYDSISNVSSPARFSIHSFGKY